MSTRTDDELEAILQRTLSRAAERAHAHPDGNEAWSRARSAPVRLGPRRAVVGVALMAAFLAVVGVTVAVQRGRGETTSVRVSDQPAPNLRLIPDPMPKGEVRVYEPTLSRSAGSPGTTVVWRSVNADRQIVVSVSADLSARSGTGPSLEQAIEHAKAVGSNSGLYLQWLVGTDWVNLSVTPQRTPAELSALARSVAVNTSTHEPDLPPQTGLREIFRGSTSSLEPLKQWHIGTISPDLGQPSVFTVGAVLPSSTFRSAFGAVGFFPLREDQRRVSVRGTTGLVSSVPMLGAASPTSAVKVEWEERGWQLSLYSDSQQRALAIAESLREPTDEEWHDLHYPAASEPEPIEEQRKALNLEASLDVPHLHVDVRSGKVVTEAGCINLVLRYRNPDDVSIPNVPEDRVCVQPAGTPGSPDLLWSAIRTVGSHRFAVSIVGIRVDAVALVGAPGQFELVEPEGVSFDGADRRTAGWVGVVALPLGGFESSTVELFADSNFDRLADSPEVRADDPIPGFDPNEAYQPAYVSLGRFGVGG